MLVVGKALRRFSLAFDARLVVEGAREVALLQVLEAMTSEPPLSPTSEISPFRV
ncbi:MAG: hypothetical protein Q8L14_07290 [Myxococcales bacterium]|nr:hypothetical protein [Myxococcales bacterium]